MKYCGYCGKELPVQTEFFCPYCGKKITENQTTKITSEQKYTVANTRKVTTAGKIISMLSAVVLLILSFFKWFELLWEEFSILGLGKLFFSLISDYHGTDLFIKSITEGPINDTDIRQSIFCAVVFILGLIVFILLFRFIGKYFSLSKRDFHNKEECIAQILIKDYNLAMTAAIILYAIIFIAMLFINSWYSDYIGREGKLIGLNKYFYISAAVALVSRTFVVEMFVVKET